MEELHKEEAFEQVALELVELYKKKNADYGDSFGKTYEELSPISAITRMNDKMNRLKNLVMQEVKQKFNQEKIDSPKVKDESINDTLKDLASYSIMTLIERRLETSQVIEKEMEGELRRIRELLYKAQKEGLLAEVVFSALQAAKHQQLDVVDSLIAGCDEWDI